MRSNRTVSFSSALAALLLLVTGLVPASAQTNEVLRVIAMPTLAEMQSRAGSNQGLMVDKSLLESWRLLRDKAVADGATIIVFELTTPGGRLDVCKEFIDDFKALREEGNRNGRIRTIAYVPEEAISAGALMALGCQELMMAPGASIGNAIPISFRGFGQATQDIPDKAQSMINGIGEAIAAGKVFDRLLVRSMIDPDLDVWSVRGGGGGDPIILDKDELDRDYTPERMEREGQQARRIIGTGAAWVLAANPEMDRIVLGNNFPYTVVSQRDDIPRALGLGDRDLASDELLKIDVPTNPIDFAGELLGQISWAWLLAIAGIVFFFMELTTPGIGIFGVASILSLVGFFVLTGDGGSTVYIPIGLLLLGFVLLFAEIFIIPGFGVAGVSGMLLVFGSIYAATVDLPGESWQERMIPDTDADWISVKAWGLTFLGAIIGSVIGSLALARNLDKLPIFKHAFVKPPVLDPVLAQTGPSAVTSYGTVKLSVGKRGKAATDLRPAGHADFDVGQVDVVSDGGYIAMGMAVEVVLVEGSRVVVTAVEEEDLS